MNIKDRMIIEEYRKQKADFERLGDVVHQIMKEMLKDAHIMVNAVQHRVKEEKSLQGKLYRKPDELQKFSDLTDILGTRIICYFADDVDRIGKLIENTFEIDWENSTDKRALLKADAFGYLSLHYICLLPANAGYPEELLGKKFEVQIRTILQHAWSDVNHDLGYKSEFGVPREIVREFARLAGLMEIADEEFMHVRDHVKEYTQDTRKKIIEDEAEDVLINLVSLSEYMLHNKKMRTFLQKLADIENSEITEIDPENYINQLKWLKVETIGDLHRMQERNEKLAFELAKKTLEGSELDILSSNVALRFLCRAELIQGKYSENEVTEFIMLTVNNRERAERQGKRLMRTADALMKDEKNG